MASFHLSHAEPGKDIPVLKRELRGITRSNIHRVEFGGLRKRLAAGDEIAVACGDGKVIVVSTCNGLQFTGSDIGRVNLRGTLHGCHQIERIFIIPGESIGIIIEAFGDIGFGARSKIHHKEAVFIRFISVALHTLPGKLRAIRRELRVGVVSLHAVCHVAGAACSQLVEIDVGVRG